jgi:DNA processing protein
MMAMAPFTPPTDPPLAPADHAAFVQRLDAKYPARLGELQRPPKSLWVAGRLPRPQERVVAIVGARAATLAGCARARALAADLGRHGIAVVSGGAFGIDAAAHEGALAANAATFAVLGSGTDVIYPDRHADLFARIRRGGGLLSEYPPGTPPRRGQFPARNRLIAALAEAVIVAEAAAHSGALITARLALELGRTLLALPGSAGTDALIRAGKALPIATADEVLSALAGRFVATAPPPPERAAEPELARAISRGANTAALLARQLGRSLPAILAELAEAELDGLIRRASGDTYEVIGHAC